MSKLRGNKPQDIILMYHSVGKNRSEYLYSVSCDELIEQINIIQDRCKIVPLKEILNPGSSPRAAITFDDAFEDFYIVFFPVLKMMGIHSTVFVPTSYVESRRQMVAGKNHCNWKQIKQMQESGLVDFGSHGHSHQHIRGMDLQQIKEDVLVSKRLLEDKLGRRIDFFAYPGGKFQDWQHKEILRLGFKAVLTSIQGFVGKNRKVLPRIIITNKCDKDSFISKLKGF